MRNSLRKKLKRILVEQELLFMEMHNTSSNIGLMSHMIIGLYIKEEFYRLKYESNHIVIIWDPLVKKPLKLKDFNKYNLEDVYYKNNIEYMDEDYFRSIIDPILKHLHINSRTYEVPQFIYIDHTGHIP